jgi:fibronectin type 3 domain-containing protein
VERCQGVGCVNFIQVATPTATSFSDAGLLTGTTYLYRVRATDATANLSAYSSVVTITTTSLDTTPPTAPGSLTANSTISSQVNLTWTASSDNVGVTVYRVERCQGSGCTAFIEMGTTTVTNYLDSGRAAGTIYRYRVRAGDAAGNLSVYSAVVSVTTAAADITPPSAPRNLTTNSPSSTQVNLAWIGSTDNVGVTGYRVERCQGIFCSFGIGFTQIAALAIQTNYVDNGRTARTSYRYRVRANDAAGNLSAYSSVVVVTTP